jgi:hypothetical protein
MTETACLISSTPLHFESAQPPEGAEPRWVWRNCLSHFHLSPGAQSHGPKAGKSGKQQVHQRCPAFGHSHAPSASVVAAAVAAPPSSTAATLVGAAIAIAVTASVAAATVVATPAPGSECEGKEGWCVIQNTSSCTRRLSIDRALTKCARRETQQRHKNYIRRIPSHRFHHLPLLIRDNSGGRPAWHKLGTCLHYFSAKCVPVKTDNSCDPVASDCNRQTTSLMSTGYWTLPE